MDPLSEPAFTLRPGDTPLLVSLPHAGTWLPDELVQRLAEPARALPDTDWHLERIYAFAAELGAGLIVPRASRYLVDLNRPPDDGPMYAGANNTGLCPLRGFDGAPLYRAAEPDAAEVRARLERWWRPYHEALAGELARLRARFGHAILWDGHSIRSELPWLFDGRLPDLNLGTADGTSCAPALRGALAQALAAQGEFSHVVDGRFKGGYITRHYGSPAAGVHAVQLEMCWSTYMAEQPPYAIDPARAARLEPVLRALLRVALDWRPDG